MEMMSLTCRAIKNGLLNKPIGFAKKQLNDILKFGQAREYNTVSEKILEKYTPFRRLSKRKCTLSDNNYFIQKFERESPLEIPPLWESMSEADKVDFIVKNRYERILSYKIMESIKNSRVEESFILSTDGKIKYYGTYNSSTHCPVPSDLAKNSIKIHNHPIQFVKHDGCWEYGDLAEVNSGSRPFSAPDVVHSCLQGAKKAYVVDSKGVKFRFIPNKGSSCFEIESLSDDLNCIRDRAFDGTNSVKEAFRKFYVEAIKRVKQYGHDFKILNFEDFNNF